MPARQGPAAAAPSRNIVSTGANPIALIFPALCKIEEEEMAVIKSLLRIATSIAAIALAADPVSAQVTLNANGTPDNGGGGGWGIFFNLTAAGSALTITELTTASTALAGGAFTIKVFTRLGSGLGGPVGSGAGSSHAGWTSLGTVSAMQGATASGISLPIKIPDLSIASGQTIGVALVFTGAGPRYFGMGSPPIQQFTDGTLTLDTGDARTAPFTITGGFFSSRGLAGLITYLTVPEPSSIALVGLAEASLALLQRRRGRRRV